jgi:ribose transport system substrate-binding protein
MKDLLLNKDEQLALNVLSRRKFLAGTTMTFSLGALLAACGGTDTNTNPNGNTSTKAYKIAYVPGMAGIPFYNMIMAGAQEAAKKKGSDVTQSAADAWDPTKQSAIVETLITNKVDAIIIAPTDPTAMQASLKKANDAGIKVLTVDTTLGDGNYSTGNLDWVVAYIGSDNLLGGKMAGEALIKAIGGKGKVYIQNQDPQATTAVLRAQGFKQAIDATNGAVTLVAETNYDKGSQATATSQTSTILEKYPDLVGIFGVNAFSAEGAAAAVKAKNKSGVVKVAHFDSSEQSIIDLRNGTVDLVIGQLPKDMGAKAVDFLLQSLGGTKPDKKLQTSFIVIDKNNVDSPEAQSAVYK